MKTLIIDTATNLMYIALVDDNLTKTKTRLVRRDISKYLVNDIKELLDENETNISKIDKIIVGKGPGSYTGLRVAGVVAKTLAYAKSIDLYEVSSLFLLTSGYDKVIAMIDARNNFVFGGVYNNGSVIVKDGHFIKSDLLQKRTDEEIVLINEESFRIDANKVINTAIRVENIHEYVPNYVNKTEAERNNEDK